MPTCRRLDVNVTTLGVSRLDSLFSSRSTPAAGRQVGVVCKRTVCARFKPDPAVMIYAMLLRQRCRSRQSETGSFWPVISSRLFAEARSASPPLRAKATQDELSPTSMPKADMAKAPGFRLPGLLCVGRDTRCEHDGGMGIDSELE